MKTLYVLGSLNMDLSVKADRYPNVGETLPGYEFHTCPGGKGLNQAIAAAKLGAKVKMLGAVGNDSFGKEMIETLKRYKVDVSHIKILENASSGIAMIVVANSDNKIVLDLGANLMLEKEDVDKFLDDAKEGDIFLCQLENSMDIISYGLKAAKAKKMVTVVDPAPMNKSIISSLKNIDVLKPNSEELHGLLEYCDIEKEFKKHLIVTLGKDGYRYKFGDTKIEGKSIKVKVVDTTGAGDTFTGALCYQLCLGKSISKEVLDFASLAASISTTKSGSSTSSPTLEELKK